MIGDLDPHGELASLYASRGRRRRGPLRALREGPLGGDGFGPWVLRAAGTALLVATCTSVVIWVVAVANGYQLAFGQLLAVFTVLLLVPWTVEAIHAPPDLPARFDPDRADLPGRPFVQADRWEHRLTVSGDDVERFNRVVRSRVAVVAAERLRQRHGVRLDRQPERARAILGDGLYDFLTGPLPRCPTPDEMDRIIARIERI